MTNVSVVMLITLSCHTLFNVSLSLCFAVIYVTSVLDFMRWKMTVFDIVKHNQRGGKCISWEMPQIVDDSAVFFPFSIRILALNNIIANVCTGVQNL